MGRCYGSIPPLQYIESAKYRSTHYTFWLYWIVAGFVGIQKIGTTNLMTTALCSFDPKAILFKTFILFSLYSRCKTWNWFIRISSLLIALWLWERNNTSQDVFSTKVAWYLGVHELLPCVPSIVWASKCYIPLLLQLLNVIFHYFCNREIIRWRKVMSCQMLSLLKVAWYL